MSAVTTTEIMTPVERLGALLRASQAISSTGDRNHRVESFSRELRIAKLLFLVNAYCVAASDRR